GAIIESVAWESSQAFGRLVGLLLLLVAIDLKLSPLDEHVADGRLGIEVRAPGDDQIADLAGLDGAGNVIDVEQTSRIDGKSGKRGILGKSGSDHLTQILADILHVDAKGREAEPQPGLVQRGRRGDVAFPLQGATGLEVVTLLIDVLIRPRPMGTYEVACACLRHLAGLDRKSTRLISSHVQILYASHV